MALNALDRSKIKREEKGFAKGYLQQWSPDVYQVVVKTRLKPRADALSRNGAQPPAAQGRGGRAARDQVLSPAVALGAGTIGTKCQIYFHCRLFCAWSTPKTKMVEFKKASPPKMFLKGILIFWPNTDFERALEPLLTHIQLHILLTPN